MLSINICHIHMREGERGGEKGFLNNLKNILWVNSNQQCSMGLNVQQKKFRYVTYGHPRFPLLHIQRKYARVYNTQICDSNYKYTKLEGPT